MLGHYGYYGITGNAPALSRFRHKVENIWRRWLGRRTRDGKLSWDAFKRVLKHYPLPPAVVVHSVYRQQPMRSLRNRMRESCTYGSVGALGE